MKTAKNETWRRGYYWMPRSGPHAPSNESCRRSWVSCDIKTASSSQRSNCNRPRQSTRPVGTNLVLVRRVRANLVSMKAEQAERLTAWGPGAPSRAPGGVQGQSPGGGPGGSAPGSSWVLAFVKGPERLYWKHFSSNQPKIIHLHGTEIFILNDTAHCHECVE